MKKLAIGPDNPEGDFWETNSGIKICVRDLVKNSPGFKKVIIEELLEEHAAMQQIPEPANQVMQNQDAEIERLEAEVQKWKEKFWEQRRHCRAANKGAERNAMMMRLLAQDCAKLQEKLNAAKTEYEELRQ